MRSPNPDPARRDAMRCALYWAKFLGFFNFHPLIVRVSGWERGVV